MDVPDPSASWATRVEVAVVGTVNLDHTVHVARLPEPGETVLGDSVRTALGGKGANQAIAAARQGARTMLVACVGDDAEGHHALAAMAAEPGLDTTRVSVVAAPTGRAFIGVDDERRNSIIATRGANDLLDEAAVHRCGSRIAGSAVLLVQLGVRRAAVVAALEVARSVGTMTVVDPSPAEDVTDEVLRLADLCTPNEHEAARLTGVDVTDPASARRAADRLLVRGCSAVVVTLGAQGAYVRVADRGDGMVIPPFRVDPVDPTAAGDAFCGALAAALARGTRLEASLVEAAAAGALATTCEGAVPSLPTRQTVEALVASA